MRDAMPDHLYPPACDVAPVWINRLLLLATGVPAVSVLVVVGEVTPLLAIAALLAGFEAWAQWTRARFRRVWREGTRLEAEVISRQAPRPLAGLIGYFWPGLLGIIETVGPERLTVRFHLAGRTVQQTRRVNTIIYYRLREGHRVLIAVDPDRPSIWMPVV